MSSHLRGWSPIVAFPAYHGPHDVGTVDVEVPAADLTAASQAPEGAAPTVAFRIFYPCVRPGRGEPDRPVRWIPNPQRASIKAFANFLGVKSPRMANIISFLPQQLYYINIPAHRNAKILEPTTSSGRWPVTVFSHGLAGSRNAYSYICGDLASQGMIVIALDHRDGSSPIQHVRATSTTDAYIINQSKISHKPSQDVYEARDKQLRIRLWELSLAYELLGKIDAGQSVENLDINASINRKERVEVLWQFDSMLDIHRAGAVTWAGHSFGAATMVQLLKSIMYHHDRPSGQKPLLAPNLDAAIKHQIIPESPMVLLDMWCFPLRSPDQTYLWNKPLPTYAVGGPSGSNVVSILSEAFYKWEDNRNLVKHVISSPSRSRRPSLDSRLVQERGRVLPKWAELRDSSPSKDSGYESRSPMQSLPQHQRRASDARSSSLYPSSSLFPSSSLHPSSLQKTGSSAVPLKVESAKSQTRGSGPHLFYVEKSQHFNQSDYGLLFPWLAKRVAKAEEPLEIMELNNRAMAQMLREAGVEIAGGADADILKKQSGVPRWVHVPVQDGDTESSAIAIERTRTGQLTIERTSQAANENISQAAIKRTSTYGSQATAGSVD